MAKDLMIDETGDIVIDQRDLGLVSDDNELEQHIWTIIKTQLGTYPLDESAGTDMFSILGTHYSKEAFQTLVETSIKSQEPQISSVELTSASMDRENDALDVKMVFHKVDGTSITTGGTLNAG